MNLKSDLLFPLTILFLQLINPCISFDHLAVSFKPAKIAQDCFPILKEPSCKFEISNNASTNLKIECITENLPEPALRIQGEFHILKISCTATYPIDFLYYGVQPTEAMFIDWRKEIAANTSLDEQMYTVEVDVYSVQALFNFYNNPLNSYFEYPNEGLPLTKVHDYSRSGNYSFPGIFNQSIGTSFYLFLEDTPKQSFLQNNHTSRIRVDGNNNLRIPCRPSHYDAKVVAKGPSGQLNTTWNPISGVIMDMEGKSVDLVYGNYTCSLIVGDTIADSVNFNFKLESPDFIEQSFGLEDFRFDSGDNIDITGEPYLSPGTPFVKYLYPLCKTKNPNSPVDEEKVQLISIPVHNFGYMRLVQQFVLPKFVNRSYTAKIVQGSENWDPLVRQLRVSNGANLRMGTVFCSTGYGEKINDFGSTIRGRVIPFSFGLDWATFPRRTSAIEVHFGIEKVNHTGPLYIDTEVFFLCRVNIPVLVKPVIWYIKTINGSYTQVAIDYNLSADQSIRSIKITNDTRAVLCASSYWYSDFWRNISMNIDPRVAMKPEIFDLDSQYKLTEGSENRNIRCTATGTPSPEIYFEKNGKRIASTTTSSDSAIILFSKVEKSHAGSYTCVAKNVYETRKPFDVVLEDEFSGQDYTLAIVIPIVVFILTALAAFIYIKFFRAEKTGLTKQEIEDFLKGLTPEEAQLTAEGNDYTHEFAVMRPYVKEYEVPPSRFKIDESKVLGKGAFGLVLEGTVDKTKVAVKTVQRNADKQYLKALLSELKIMIHLGHHDNVISVVGACTKDLRRGFVYVFVKYIPLGNLQTYLRKHKEFYNPSTTEKAAVDSADKNSDNFGPTDLLCWSHQIASGMQYLGSKNVIHGDLALRNVLLDENKIVKITDFGLSRQLYDYNDYIKKHQEPLPWRWMALESLKFMSFSKQSDVWSFGVTIWEVYSLGEIPYPGYSWNLEFVDNLENGLRMSKPKYGTIEIFGIMCECWNPDPVKRPTFTVLEERLFKLLNNVENSN